MRALANFAEYPAGRPLVSDDIIEFHAARLLLLLQVCGTKNRRIDGLTKLAKLDFFVRYPGFFARACEQLGVDATFRTAEVETVVESTMVRYHYGPWDHRYYHVLAYLEGKGLVEVSRGSSKAFQFELTDRGIERAKMLSELAPFQEQAVLMRQVRKILGKKTGSQLKDLVYQLFGREVAERPLGEEIGE